MVLLESLTQDLDVYADLSADGEDVEGITDFLPGKRPRVRISNRLSTQSRLENRLRTTLTHELGHVKFHTFMFDIERPQSLFSSAEPESNKCKRDSILGASQSDWMEWQAGFACGAFLMPSVALAEFIAVGSSIEAPHSPTGASSPEGLQLISGVANYFQVSREAAQVRLLQQRVLTELIVSSDLF
jgi:Zn-dependent peptidase ImmA (M78 family)